MAVRVDGGLQNVGSVGERENVGPDDALDQIMLLARRSSAQL